MAIKIEKNIALDINVGRGRVSRYPLRQMQVGDSFAVDDEKQLKAARNAAYLYRKKNFGWDYGSVKHKDGSGRIWRTK